MAHARVIEEALAASRFRLPWRRREALDRLTRAYFALDEKAPLMVSRARYIESETAFNGLA